MYSTGKLHTGEKGIIETISVSTELNPSAEVQTRYKVHRYSSLGTIIKSTFTFFPK